MVRRLWLFGLILGVPIAGLLAAVVTTASMDRQVRAALREQVPDADPQTLAAVTLVGLCEESRAELPELCGTSDNVELLLSGSVVTGMAGLAMVLTLWLMGVMARAGRSLLLYLFKPGLYLTALAVIVLVVLHGVIATSALYYVESTLIERVHFGIILAIGLGAGYGVLTIAQNVFRLVKNASTVVIGVTVDRKNGPRLWQRIDAAAKTLSALPPQNLVVGLDPNFFVTEAEVRCLSGKLHGRTLYCSLPLSRILTEEEFLAIVGHELGHFKGLDTKYSERFYPIYRGTGDALAQLSNSGSEGAGTIALLPAIAVFSYFLECFAVAENRISRARELEADRAGVQVSSVSAMASALVKVHAFSGVWNQVQEAAMSLIGQGKVFINASSIYADAVSNAAATANALKGVTETHLSHPTDSHPPLSVRLQSLGVTLGTVAKTSLVVAPMNPAIVLIDEPEKLEEEISSAYQELLARHLPAAEAEEAAQT